MRPNHQGGQPRPEDVFLPHLPIIDPHVHLWDKSGFDYYAADLLADVHDGHKVEKTVYVECHMGYNDDQREAFRAVGETNYVLEQLRNVPRTQHDLAAGILGNANLMLGPHVRPILDAHIATGQGRFRGLRAHVAFHPHPDVGYPDLPRYPKTNIMRTNEFLAGVRCVRDLDLALDIFALHTQIDDIIALALKVPEMPIMIDHCGGPIGVGPYAAQSEETFVEWSGAIRRAAAIPNLHIKLSGLGMARLGFKGAPALTSNELVTKWKPHVRACVDAFGSDRAIFASNFPVDKVAGSYRVVVNAYKKMLSDLSENDLQAIFYENARRFYKL
jgi:L-fuconolactonase